MAATTERKLHLDINFSCRENLGFKLFTTYAEDCRRLFSSYKNVGILPCDAACHLRILKSCPSVTYLTAGVNMGSLYLSSTFLSIQSGLTEYQTPVFLSCTTVPDCRRRSRTALLFLQSLSGISNA